MAPRVSDSGRGLDGVNGILLRLEKLESAFGKSIGVVHRFSHGSGLVRREYSSRVTEIFGGHSDDDVRIRFMFDSGCERAHRGRRPGTERFAAEHSGS